MFQLHQFLNQNGVRQQIHYSVPKLYHRRLYSKEKLDLTALRVNFLLGRDIKLEFFSDGIKLGNGGLIHIAYP
jgi:hypothetical protein